MNYEQKKTIPLLAIGNEIMVKFPRKESFCSPKSSAGCTNDEYHQTQFPSKNVI